MNAPEKSAGGTGMSLDEQAIAAARGSIDDGAVTPGFGPWRDDILALLDSALATEWVGALRTRRHHFTAQGLASPAVAEQFLAHSNAMRGHADQLAERIVQLGGEPDLDPATLIRRSHGAYDEPDSLEQMVRSNLAATRAGIESYRQMIRLIENKDPTTRRMLQAVLEDAEDRAEDLSRLIDR